MSLNNLTDRIPISSEIRLAIFCLILVGIYSLFDKAKHSEVTTTVIDEQRAVSSVEIERGDITKNQVIFTFDGGDGNNSCQKILDVLRKHGVRGSFFLTGKFVESNKELIKEMIDDDHEVYNHTYNHHYLTEIPDEQISAELLKTEDVIKNLTGKTTRPYFRPPYGNRDQRVLDQAFKEGYQSVVWTVDALDWQESFGQNPEEVKYRVLSTLAPGNIYLMHIGDNITGDILDELFTVIKEKGYNIVSLKQGI